MDELMPKEGWQGECGSFLPLGGPEGHNHSKGHKSMTHLNPRLSFRVGLKWPQRSLLGGRTPGIPECLAFSESPSRNYTQSTWKPWVGVASTALLPPVCDGWTDGKSFSGGFYGKHMREVKESWFASFRIEDSRCFRCQGLKRDSSFVWQRVMCPLGPTCFSGVLLFI